MTPVWFPWIVVGGLLFTLLGYIGSKYKDKPYRTIQSLQDFISGSILVAFTGVVMPDFFPPMELPSLPGGDSISQSSANEIDLQVGPPRLIRGF